MNNILCRLIIVVLLVFSQTLEAQNQIKIGVLTSGEGCNIDWKAALPDYEVVDASEKNFLISQHGWNLESRLLKHKPDYCIIYGGLSDILLQLPSKNIAEAYIYLCNLILQHNVKPILVGVLPARNHPAVNSIISQLNVELQMYASRNGVYYCPADKGLVCKDELDLKYANDDFMLNKKGRNVFAQNISDFINDVVSLTNGNIVSDSTAHNLTSMAVNNILSSMPQKVNIVMLGNSITAGGGNWNNWLERDDVLNAGQGGYTSGQMLWHIDTTVVRLQPKVCFVMAGINDLFNNVPPDVIYRNQIQILNKLRARGIKPVVQLTLYTHENPSLAIRIDAINERIKEYCDKESIDIINLNTQLSVDKNLKKEYTTDGTHLTEEAYGVWSKELIRYIKEKM